jgi:hypothetical protein
MQSRQRDGVVVQLYSFFKLDARRMCVVNVTPRPVYPRDKDGNLSTGGWVNSTDGLERSGKSRPHQDSNCIPSRPWPIAISFTLFIFNPYVNIHFWREKAIGITHSVCVLVALFIQHVERMRHITLLCVACLDQPYFPHTIT